MNEIQQADAIEREWYATVPKRNWKATRSEAMTLLLELLRDEAYD